MPIAPALLLTLTAAVPVKTIVAPDLSAVHIDPAVATFYTEHLGQSLVQQGFTVMTAKQINSLLGLERQRQLLGCSGGGSSCMAELASALGADAIVSGSVAKIGDRFQLNVSLLKGSDGSVLVVYQARASSEEELLDRLSDAAVAFAHGVRARTSQAATTVASLTSVTAPSPAPRGTAWLWTGGAGLVVGAIGAGGLALASANHDQLVSPTSTLDSYGKAADASRAEQLQQVLGWTGVALGGCAIAAAIVLWQLPAPDRSKPEVSLSVGAGHVVVHGSF